MIITACHEVPAVSRTGILSSCGMKCVFLIVEALGWIAQIRGKSNKYITLFIGEGATRVRHSLSEVYKFKLVRYIYIYIYVCMEVCGIIVVHATYK